MASGIPFLCPVCSAPMKAALLGRIHCPRCGGSYLPTHADRLARTLGALVPQTGESAEELQKRTIAHLAKIPLPADPMTHWNDKLSTKSVRVIGTSGDVTGPALVVCVAAPWSGEVTVSVFNDLLKLSKLMEQGKLVSRFQFLAPQPMPEAVVFTFGATNRGRFERMALLETGLYDPEILVAPARVPKLVEAAVRLVKTCFHLDLDLRETSHIRWIEELVLKELRLPHSPLVPLPRGTYTPHCSLLLLALAVGQILLLRRGGPGWRERRSFPFSLSLVLEPEETVDPISQVVNLFVSGAASALAAVGKELSSPPAP